jgi:midasin (ATPase involved in ribosome maturation)
LNWYNKVRNDLLPRLFISAFSAIYDDYYISHELNEIVALKIMFDNLNTGYAIKLIGHLRGSLEFAEISALGSIYYQ